MCCMYGVLCVVCVYMCGVHVCAGACVRCVCMIYASVCMHVQLVSKSTFVFLCDYGVLIK